MSVVIWEQPYRGSPTATVTAIEYFSARGTKRVYGRGDHYQRRTFNLDIWRDRAGRLRARFWSRSSEVEDQCWEIIGVPDTRQLDGPLFNDQWVPDCLRKQYDAWVLANF
jgi:hypothetical protein